jgi:hypothetical protein
MCTAWAVVLGLALLRLTPVVSVCEGFGEVTCGGDPSDAWVNSNLMGPSLPPAGIPRRVRVWGRGIGFLEFMVRSGLGFEGFGFRR